MNDSTKSIDAVIVGAGFAGIYMLDKLRQQGLEARVIEAGSGVAAPGIEPLSRRALRHSQHAVLVSVF